MVYDGYTLPLDDACHDVVFSDQLIEHLHPEDTELHFGLVHRLLAPGGTYLFRTPHALCGPHDVSRWFSDTPQGFHLKEWTSLALAANGHLWLVTALEAALCRLPARLRRRVSRWLLPNVTVAATR